MDEHDSPDLRPRGNQPAPAGPVVAGRYRVERLIARGGMAAVFLAEHIALRRRVALKILHPPPDAEESGNYAQRFRLEAETLATLDHPNIVTLYDYGGAEEGRFYLAMEYIEGPRYTDILANGALDPERTIKLLLQVCAALRYAHKRGVVHRDLKPSNLLIRTDGEGAEQLKVVDFGLVKVTEIDQSLTREGLVLGSPHCMAPEQVRGSAEIDHRADIYAIGILLFRSLTGTYPFHGATSTATMVAHLNEPVPRFSSVAPDLRVSARLEDVTRRCLAKSPADRFPDVKALMDALVACSGATAEPDTQSSSTKEVPAPESPTASVTMDPSARSPYGAPAPGEKRDRRPLLALLALLLLLSLSGVVYLASGGPEPEAERTTLRDPSSAPSAGAEGARATDPVGAGQGTAPVAPTGDDGSGVAAPDATAGTPSPSPNVAGSGAAPGGTDAPPADVGAGSTPPDATAQPADSRTSGRKPRAGGTTRPPSAPKTENVPSNGEKTEKPPEGYMPLPDDFQ